MDRGNSKPLLVAAREPDGGTVSVILKLMNPPVEDGHFGPTSLACEMICAVLARSAGLTVPDFGVAEVSREFAESVPDRQIRKLLLANLGPNFGTRYMAGRPSWVASYSPRGDLLGRLEGVITFDCTLINGDRTRSKPNLLWDGDDVVLIDHSLALPMCKWSDEEINESPLMPEKHVYRHAVFPALRDQGQGYRDLLDTWTALPWADITAIRSWLPPQWERRRGDIDKIFSFLAQRHKRFKDVRTELVRVVK